MSAAEDKINSHNISHLDNFTQNRLVLKDAQRELENMAHEFTSKVKQEN
jgi:hypothetical protein